MYPGWVSSALVGFLVIWLGGLSILVWKQNGFLKSLFPKSGERDIRKKFEEVSKEILNFRQQLDKLNGNLSLVERLDLKHIQRIELLRYNPYQDSGGDQSFTIALLDNEGNGFVLTSLHARSQTRVFAKQVLKGKSGKHQFSKEEELVINKAMEVKRS